jgi:hypothetical protein
MSVTGSVFFFWSAPFIWSERFIWSEPFSRRDQHHHPADIVRIERAVWPVLLIGQDRQHLPFPKIKAPNNK